MDHQTIARALLFMSLIQPVPALDDAPSPFTSSCPVVCACAWDEGGIIISATCSGRNLTSVPSGLPRSLRRLVLSSNHITAMQSDAFRLLSKLEFLDVSHNQLSSLCSSTSSTSSTSGVDGGSIPDEERSLAETNIVLTPSDSERNITPVSGGIAPCFEGRSPFSSLTRLQTLVLHDNQLHRLDAYQFSGLSNLISLDLSNNRLSSLEDRAFDGLSSLRTLDLANNLLTSGFPTTVFRDLANLTELSIQLNLQDGSGVCYVDQALSHLVNLRRLHMDGLAQPCLPGPGFRNLTRLSLLDFSHGRCSLDSIPERFFSNISTKADLTVLVGDCKITSVHRKAFSYLPTLVSVDVTNNDQMGCATVYQASVSFPQTRIKNLAASHINQVRFLRLTAETFKYLGHTTLEVLIMSRNKILLIDIGVAASLPKSLKYLDLSDNSIITVEFIMTAPFLVQLETLVISRQNNYNYMYAYSHHYQMSDKIDGEYPKDNNHCHIIQGKTNFQQIGLKSTNSVSKIRSPHSSDQVRSALLELKREILVKEEDTGTMSLGQWQLLVGKLCSRPTPKIISSRLNDTAAILTLSELNRMLTTVSDNINIFPNSLGLDFNNNSNSRFSELQTFSLPRNLLKLYASKLKLGYTIPKFGVTMNAVLQYADFSSNNLWCFGGPLFGLNSLQYLDLSGNFAIVIHEQMFQALGSIERLNLSQNKLATSFQLDEQGTILSFLKRLRVLEMHHNGLRVLHHGAFAGNDKLQRLVLNHNELNDFPSITHLRELKYLDISTNSMRRLSHETMAALEHIWLTSKVEVDLSDNPLICDCESVDFLAWFKTTSVTLIGKHNYSCEYINGSRIFLTDSDAIIPELWRLCHGEKYFPIALGLFLCFLLVITSMALTSYHRYRLLFFIYLSKQRFFCHLNEPEEHRRRDVFFVYDDQEVVFRKHALDVVLPNLERQGLTYHVTEVGLDTPSAGRSVREIVEEAILSGRKTVVLLTRDIFEDEEKQMVVGMAKLAEELLAAPRLIFLATRKLNPRELPDHIYRMLRISRIIWYRPENEQFWINLAKEVKG